MSVVGERKRNSCGPCEEAGIVGRLLTVLVLEAKGCRRVVKGDYPCGGTVCQRCGNRCLEYARVPVAEGRAFDVPLLWGPGGVPLHAPSAGGEQIGVSKRVSGVDESAGDAWAAVAPGVAASWCGSELVAGSP